MKPDTLTRRQLNRATLARQLLLERHGQPPVDALERLCGLQAQEPSPPFTGLWSRVAGFRREDLHAALHAGAVVRATLMRGTLHLVSARDYAAFRAALGPAMAQAMKVLGARAEGLDLERILPVARALFAEQPRTFAEARAALADAFPGACDRGLGYAVRLHLPLVMVPTEDRWGYPSVARFALAERWVNEPLSDDGAPEPLVLRYLAAFGPASSADVQTWSGLPALKRVLEGLRPKLRVFRDERGRELFDLPGAPRPAEDVPVPARFLPEFDNLVLAHADRTRVLADEHRALVVTKNLRVRATFLHDGFAAGTWDVERSRGTATLRLAPFGRVPRSAARALTEEGAALLRFVAPDTNDVDVRVEAAG